MVQNRDLDLIASRWENYDIPKDKKYLLRYFDTPLQITFLKYILIFGDIVSFTEHTGIKARIRWLQHLFERYKMLEQKKKEARMNMDMTTLAIIESGNYQI